MYIRTSASIVVMHVWVTTKNIADIARAETVYTLKYSQLGLVKIPMFS